MSMALQSLKNGWQATADIVNHKLKKEVYDFLKKHAEAELFIVTGDAGAGKSSFIESLTGQDVYVGSTLKSGTTTTTLVPAVIGNKRCLFLDMPGFNTRDFDDWDIFTRLMSGMSVVQPYVQFRGVLYVDTMEGDRITPSAEKILTWLYYFCGNDFMPNVTIVTTKWDGLDSDGIETKLTRFNKWQETNLLQRFFFYGASSYHHGLVWENGNHRTLNLNKKADQRRSRAREMIAVRYQGATDKKLQIQIDIANGAALEATKAGRWLKYGHGESASPEGETSSSNPLQSDSNGQERRRANNARPNGNPEPSETGGWGEQFSNFFEDPNRIWPWVKLLVNATKMYMRSSSYDEAFFSRNDSFSEAFESADGFYYEFVPSDNDSDLFEEDSGWFGGGSGWCLVM